MGSLAVPLLLVALVLGVWKRLRKRLECAR